MGVSVGPGVPLLFFFSVCPALAMEREGKARGWRQLSLNMWMFGSSPGVFRKLFFCILLVFIRSFWARRGAGGGANDIGREREVKAPLLCLNEFTQQASRLIPQLHRNHHKTTVGYSSRNFLSTIGCPIEEFLHRSEHNKENPADGRGREGHCLLVAVGDGKSMGHLA